MYNCQLGKVVKIRGYKGEFVVQTKFKNVELFRTLKNVSIEQKIFVVEDFKNLKDRVGLKLQGVDTEQLAKSFVGKNVFYNKSEIVFSKELQLEDMLNFELVDENNFIYGYLEDIENYGAGNILVVRKNNKEILLPQNKNFITGYDKQKQQILVDSKLIKEVM